MSTFEIESASIEESEEAYLLRMEEVKQSWKLRPEEKKAKKTINFKYFALSREMFLLIVFMILLILSASLIAIVKTVLDHRHHQPQFEKYTVTLDMALKFFDAQRSGRLPEGNDVSWRGDSCLNDGKRAFRDLVGGYYDGGDATKTASPTSFAMTMLSWSVIEYSTKFEAVGSLQHVKDNIKWGTDYLLKTFDSTSPTLNMIVQKVGNGNDDRCWMRPEDIINDYDRQVSACQTCSALAAEMVAALASASIVFRDDKTYSEMLVHGAKLLFKFSEDRSLLQNGTDDGVNDMIWGATWLFYATGEYRYLQIATSQDLALHAGAFREGNYSYGVMSQDNKLPGAQLLLTRLRIFWATVYPYEKMLTTFHRQTNEFMCSYLSRFIHFGRTKGGLIKLNNGRPRPLQYVVNAVFLAKVYRDYLQAAGISEWSCGPYNPYRDDLLKFAYQMVDYIIGLNPKGMSYVVGYGNKYPMQVHHMGASIPYNKKKYNCDEGQIWRDSPRPNPNIIIGAMVAGPDQHDGFEDVRTNSNYTEATLIGNAGLVAALVAMSSSSHNSLAIDVNSINYALPRMILSPPVPPPPWQP